jgi:hypothetical protein
LLTESNLTLSQNYRHVYKDYQLCKSVTNEVERVLGKQITEKNVLDAREELSTFVIMDKDNKQADRQAEDKLSDIVSSIFRQKPQG